ncbi:SCO family protein [Salinicoccus roseus]|uniref:Cysteine ABC transporter ATP-binding protein n=1 Tax=Salinicoccus roseus TaxID=45670 RepID=A0A0C2HH40_9STAP|nr:SCO family protein [Salinicoccus roseus]KIH70959.1 cysteine ABC transporter ATP-binding protein [Salinicoccus roseus]MDB0580184.1 SCO family protein [Salinicoccus roseus]OZT78279.1 SCO family protein [Salinicoccus roseus]
MRKSIFIVFILTLILSACSASGVETMSRYGNTVDDFEVTNQDGETFTREDMEGKVWLLDFIFTNCATVCPPMTANMTEVVTELEARGVEDYGVLSFSVDPETDSPEVLTDYIEYYNVPEGVDWQLVTGYDYDFIRGFAENNFKTIVAPPPEGSNQVTHGISFYLIDQQGKIIKDYPGVDTGDTEFPLEEVVSDVETLAEEGPK